MASPLPPPVIFFDSVSVGDAVVSASAVPVATPAGLPQLYVGLDLDKTLFFGPAGFRVVVSTDAATGAVASVQAAARDNVDQAYFQARLAGANAQWNADGYANLLYRMGTSSEQRAVNFSTAAARAALGPSSLGLRVMQVLAAIVSPGSSSALEGTFYNVPATAAAIEAAVAASVKAFLATNAGQDAIFQKIMQLSGPIAPAAAGEYSVPYAAAMASVTLAFCLRDLQLQVSYGVGAPTTIRLDNFPLFLRLVAPPP